MVLVSTRVPSQGPPTCSHLGRPVTPPLFGRACGSRAPLSQVMGVTEHGVSAPTLGAIGVLEYGRPGPRSTSALGHLPHLQLAKAAASAWALGQRAVRGAG